MHLAAPQSHKPFVPHNAGCVIHCPNRPIARPKVHACMALRVVGAITFTHSAQRTAACCCTALKAGRCPAAHRLAARTQRWLRRLSGACSCRLWRTRALLAALAGLLVVTSGASSAWVGLTWVPKKSIVDHGRARLLGHPREPYPGRGFPRGDCQQACQGCRQGTRAPRHRGM